MNQYKGNIPAAARPTTATEYEQNTLAPLCVMVQLTHVHTHGLTKEMRAE